MRLIFFTRVNVFLTLVRVECIGYNWALQAESSVLLSLTFLCPAILPDKGGDFQKMSLGSESLGMTYEGLGEVADKCSESVTKQL